MPGIMFQDVVCSRSESNSKWYTVPLSCLVHTTVLAVIITIPIIATDMTLPTPRSLMEQYVSPYMPVVPQQLAMRHVAPAQTTHATPGVIDVPPPAPLAPSGPVAVGGHIKPPLRIKYVMPKYPEIARASRVQGVVILEAIIGADGKVASARVLRSNPLLEQAALAAVRAWEYTPTLLNGRPTPVIMTVTVQFTLK